MKALHSLIPPSDIFNSVLLPQYVSPPAIYCAAMRINYDAARAARDSARQRIHEFKMLTDNWDGYGAEVIRAPILEHATALLDTGMPAPEYVSPRPAGTIAFEWETHLGKVHLELGVKTYSFYLRPSEGEPILDGGNITEVDGGKISFFGAAINSLTVPASTSATSALGHQLGNAVIKNYTY